VKRSCDRSHWILTPSFEEGGTCGGRGNVGDISHHESEATKLVVDEFEIVGKNSFENSVAEVFSSDQIGVLVDDGAAENIAQRKKIFAASLELFQFLVSENSRPNVAGVCHIVILDFVSISEFEESIAGFPGWFRVPLPLAQVVRDRSCCLVDEIVIVVDFVVDRFLHSSPVLRNEFFIVVVVESISTVIW